MSRRPTVYEVARRAGVSTATVSFAFSRPERVRPATLERVLAAARDLGYLPSAAARGLARGVTGVIGLHSFDYLIDDDGPTDPDATGYRRFPLYVDEVQYGVELECRRLGQALMVSGARTPGPALPVVDIAGRVDGLITFAGSLSDEALRTVAGRIPVVALGRERPEGRIGTVRVDDGAGVRQVLEHLLLVHGCRRPVFVGERTTAEIRDRHRAFGDVLTEAGLPVPEPLPSRPGVDRTTIEAVRSRLAGDRRPDAFVCSTDQEALVTLDTVAAAGLSVPDDVRVTGFDGIVAGRLSHPTLTTVRQPMSEIGRAAVSTLRSLMRDEPVAAVEPLGVRLRLGTSCGCPPDRTFGSF
jgi:DNA-binding LacI/PurR family transcriptional regulator